MVTQIRHLPANGHTAVVPARRLAIIQVLRHRVVVQAGFLLAVTVRAVRLHVVHRLWI